MSAWFFPVLVPFAAIALVVMGRERASWWFIPALWPSTQWYYTLMAMPALTPLTAAVLAAPVQGGPAVAAIVAAVELWWRARRARPARLVAAHPTTVCSALEPSAAEPEQRIACDRPGADTVDRERRCHRQGKDATGMTIVDPYHPTDGPMAGTTSQAAARRSTVARSRCTSENHPWASPQFHWRTTLDAWRATTSGSRRCRRHQRAHQDGSERGRRSPIAAGDEVRPQSHPEQGQAPNSTASPLREVTAVTPNVSGG